MKINEIKKEIERKSIPLAFPTKEDVYKLIKLQAQLQTSQDILKLINSCVVRHIFQGKSEFLLIDREELKSKINGEKEK